MTSPASGPLRALRAAVLTAVLVTIGSTAHALGGGMAPSALVVAVLSILLTPVVLMATRVRLGPGRAAAYLAGAQLGIHLALHSMHPVTGSATSGHHVHGGDAAVLAAGHASGALGASSDMAGMAGMSHLGGVLGLTPTMLLAHLVATVLTAWVVGRGEDILWRVFSVLLPRFPRPARGPSRALGAVTTALRIPREAAPGGSLGSRAPPPAVA